MSLADWDVVIGIETHAQLLTESKMFSGASTRFGAAPNTQACALDLALPGTLPVPNRLAIERAISFGLAVGGHIAPLSRFERKNYFYPDLPKGYQISQFQVPVVSGGVVQFTLDGQPRRVQLTRAHLEEDAGKSLHEDFHGLTGIDLNRAGTPLLEIVSEPQLDSAKAASAYGRALHALVVWLGVCDGNMQEGSFRMDANVSVKRKGETKLGTRCEIKNLNSFRFLEQAIGFEMRRQIDLIEDGGTVRQETRLFDPDSGETRTMRSKEDSHDYRYFPDPDLPPIAVDSAWIERVRSTMPELPANMAERWSKHLGLSTQDCAQLTQSRAHASYFESCLAAVLAHAQAQAQTTASQPSPTVSPEQAAKLVSNWMNGELAAQLNREERTIDTAPISHAQLALLVWRVLDGTLSSKTAKEVFAALWARDYSQAPSQATSPDQGQHQNALDTPQAVDHIIQAKGLRQLNDDSALEAIIQTTLADNPALVSDYQSGKTKAFQALVGQVMKRTQGKANPQQVNAQLKAKLG